MADKLGTQPNRSNRILLWNYASHGRCIQEEVYCRMQKISVYLEVVRSVGQH